MLFTIRTGLILSSEDAKQWCGCDSGNRLLMQDHNGDNNDKCSQEEIAHSSWYSYIRSI